MNKFYVYTHNDKHGNIRYIGKGSGKRYKSNYDRGNKYELAVLENGSNFTYHIIYDKLSEDEALNIEVELFNKYVSTGLLINAKQPNKNKSNFVKEIPKEIIEKFYIDSSIPNGIRWKEDVVGGFGAVLIKAGTPAGGIVKSSGYYSTGLMGEYYQNHRIVYALSTGESNLTLIDHIDGNKSNNAIQNLRQCCHQTNMMNKKKYKRKDETIPWGISWHKRDLEWSVRITDPSIQTESGRNKLISKVFNPAKYDSVDAALEAAICYRDWLVISINLKLVNNGLPIYSSDHGGKCV